MKRTKTFKDLKGPRVVGISFFNPPPSTLPSLTVHPSLPTYEGVPRLKGLQVEGQLAAIPTFPSVKYKKDPLPRAHQMDKQAEAEESALPPIRRN